MAAVTIPVDGGQRARVGRDWVAARTIRECEVRSPADGRVVAASPWREEPAPTISDGRSEFSNRGQLVRARATQRDPGSPGRSREDEATSPRISPFPEPLASRYRAIDRLGSGGESEIHLAQRRSDGALVVVKLYRPGVAPSRDVLALVQALPSAAVVAIHEFGEAGGCFFEVVEYVPGGTLANLFIPGQGVPERVALDFLEEIAAILATLHAPDWRGRSLIHRDLKPTNVFVRSLDPLDFALGDFGVATIAAGDAPPAKCGYTPDYAAPENFAGRPLTASDYWSLGMVCLEALTGAHPFLGLDEAAIRARLESGWEPDLTGVTDSAWRRLLNGLLHLDAANRWGAIQLRQWLAARTASMQPPHWPDAFTAEVAESYDWLQPASREGFALMLIQHWEGAAPLLRDEPPSPRLVALVTGHAPEINLSDVYGAGGTSADLRLLRLVRRLAPDLPPVWKRWPLEAPDMSAICDSASGGDSAMRLLVSELVDWDVLGEIGREGHHDSGLRGARWRHAIADFEQSWDAVRRYGGPVDLQPDRNEALSRLYRAVCDGAAGVETPVEVDPALMICCRWFAAAAGGHWHELTPARRWTRAILAPVLTERHADNLRTAIPFSPGERVEAQLIRRWGRNPPTAALNATHRDIVFTVCDHSSVVAKRVRVAWSTAGAAWVYLVQHGTVRPTGDIEVTIAEARSFALLAIGPGGVAYCRTATIATAFPVLEPPDKLDQAVVALDSLLALEIDANPDATSPSPVVCLDENLVETTLPTIEVLDETAVDMKLPNPSTLAPAIRLDPPEPLDTRVRK